MLVRALKKQLLASSLGVLMYPAGRFLDSNSSSSKYSTHSFRPWKVLAKEVTLTVCVPLTDAACFHHCSFLGLGGVIPLLCQLSLYNVRMLTSSRVIAMGVLEFVMPRNSSPMAAASVRGAPYWRALPAPWAAKPALCCCCAAPGFVPPTSVNCCAPKTMPTWLNMASGPPCAPMPGLQILCC